MSCLSDHLEITKFLLEIFPHPEYKNAEGKKCIEMTTNEKIIADIAKATWDYFITKTK